MGYVIHQLPSLFTLRRAHFPAALAAVRRLHEAKFFTGVPGSERVSVVADRSFVDGKRVMHCATLEEALYEWRWVAIIEEPPDGMPGAEPSSRDIMELEFVGEKLGNEDALFAALAPFVEERSYIAVVGEDGRVWRWLFRSGQCCRQAGSISYDDGTLGEPCASGL